MEDFVKIAEKYIENVLKGAVKVSKTTKKTYLRHKDDLKHQKERGIVFDPDGAANFMKFASRVKHTKGRKFAGKPFKLEPWQCGIIYIVFGWRWKSGSRRFSKAYIEVAKKNGKTAFAGLVADWLLLLDDEPMAEVYCAATKKDQARICFDQAKSYIEKHEKIKKHCGALLYRTTVSIPSSGSKMTPLGRDSSGLDGINPSGAIIDEYHEWGTDEVLEVIESASVGRVQTLVWIITTAGFNKDGPCYAFRRFCLDILDGVKQQEDVFAIIFTLDDDDDWRDETCWIKANPNYDISVEVDKMREQFKRAVNQGGRTEVNFKTKNLNMWVNAPEAWLTDDVIQKNSKGYKPDDLLKKPCYAGLDLASHTDINALILFFPKYDNAVKCYFWLPESKIEEKKDRVDYGLWKEQGYLIVTPGNVVDIDQQIEDIDKIIKQHDIQGLAYDPAKAYNGTIQGLMKLGHERLLHEFPQSVRVMGEPTKELEKMLTGAQMDLMDNPVLRWMFRNVVLLRDTNDNIKPDRKRSREKIDGVVALINAMGEYMTMTYNKKSGLKLRVLSA